MAVSDTDCGRVSPILHDDITSPGLESLTLGLLIKNGCTWQMTLRGVGPGILRLRCLPWTFRTPSTPHFPRVLGRGVEKDPHGSGTGESGGTVSSRVGVGRQLSPPSGGYRPSLPSLRVVHRGRYRPTGERKIQGGVSGHSSSPRRGVSTPRSVRR